jgi:hypothetical protein
MTAIRELTLDEMTSDLLADIQLKLDGHFSDEEVSRIMDLIEPTISAREIRERGVTPHSD